MQFPAFLDLHLPALERDQARHNILLTILAAIRDGDAPEGRWWSPGGPGACAAQVPGRPVVLGDLARAQCRALAEALREDDLPGVLGPDLTAKCFVARAEELGLRFCAPMPQRILALSAPPRAPEVPGRAREVTAADTPLFADWLTAFYREAVPQDRLPPREVLERAAGQGGHLFWEVEGRPVALAGIVRRTRDTAAIARVYTPPELRGRGYAGAATAAVVELIYAEGRTTACLYCDLRNPASRRCYAKLGFAPVCDSWYFPRQAL